MPVLFIFCHPAITDSIDGFNIFLCTKLIPQTLDRTQQIITIALCVLGTQLTRFVPFLIFNEHRKTPAFVQYLGKVLPGAIFSMLVVYCLRSVSFRRYSYGLPELIGIFITAGLHLWKRNILLSIAAGTITYMLLIRYVFV